MPTGERTLPLLAPLCVVLLSLLAACSTPHASSLQARPELSRPSPMDAVSHLPPPPAPRTPARRTPARRPPIRSPRLAPCAALTGAHAVGTSYTLERTPGGRRATSRMPRLSIPPRTPTARVVTNRGGGQILDFREPRVRTGREGTTVKSSSVTSGGAGCVEDC